MQNEGLGAWERADEDLFGAVGRVASHPAFATASRALASGMFQLAASDKVLDALFKDGGRYVAAMWAFALHEDGGLTLPRLKSVCLRMGLLSPGRARLLIQLLEHYGYLERQSGARSVVYAPTPAFRAAWDRHFVAALEAAMLIEPQIASMLGPKALEARQAYGRIHAEGMMRAMGAEPQISSFLRIFLHPYAGAQVLWTLVGAAKDQTFPPEVSGPISVLGLARTCGASRSQVGRILTEAQDEGLISLDAAGMVRFSAPAQQELAFFYAFQLVQILAAAAKAVRQP